MMRVPMQRILGVMALSGCLAACATAVPTAPDPYLATYRPLELPNGGIVAFPTVSLDGRLSVIDGCFVVTSTSGALTMVAFAPQVSVVRANGLWGLRDGATGRRVVEGDMIGVGGASVEDASAFVEMRFTSPPPPAACPKALFVSNSGFEKK